MDVKLGIEVLLTSGVLAAWLGLAAFVRLKTPLERLHVVTFVNLAAGFPICLAAILTAGAKSGSVKIAIAFVATVLIGSLTGHATARALHLREGERR